MGIVAAAMAVIGVAQTIEARSDAKDAQRESRRAQENSRQEQRAANAAAAAKERRQQIREERVRRARVMQTAANTGTAGSSGELGALGALSTNLNTNIGYNLGALQTAENLSIFGQQQADAQGRINNAQMDMQLGQSIFSAGMSIGGATGWNMGGDFWKSGKKGP